MEEKTTNADTTYIVALHYFHKPEEFNNFYFIMFLIWRFFILMWMSESACMYFD